MGAILDKVMRRSKTAVIAYHIFDNFRAKIRYGLGRFEDEQGATHASMSVEDSVAYIERVFGDYVEYGNLSKSSLENSSILELGPGDNLGVALKFIASGGRQVICLDKFYSKRDSEHQRRIYETLRSTLDSQARENYDSAIDLRDDCAINSERIRYMCGVPLEKAEALFPPCSFDFIVSNAVLEHVADPTVALAVMHRFLKPGGRLIHKIDLRDHGLFTYSGYHPLTFLTVPAPIYTLMTRDSAKPNRMRADFYTTRLASAGYESTVWVTRIAGSDHDVVPYQKKPVRGVTYFDSTIELIRKIRTELTFPYRSLSDEELMVSGIFLSARKPG